MYTVRTYYPNPESYAVPSNPLWECAGSSRHVDYYSSHTSYVKTEKFRPRNGFLEMLCRIAKAVATVFQNLYEKLLDCFRSRSKEIVTIGESAPKKLTYEERIAQYKALPSTTPEFERAALDLAIKEVPLTEEEVSDIKTCMALPTFTRILIRAAIFSEKSSMLSRYGCAGLWLAFQELSEPDKVAILSHFDSECQQIGDKYYLIPQNPENDPRPSTPEKMEISEAAVQWRKDFGALNTEAGNRYHPIMKAIERALRSPSG
jgi:hypothetical protein